MRNLIFSLFALLSLSISAQQTKTCTFDFTKPTTLNPSVTPAEKYLEVILSDSVFRNGPIRLYFTNKNNMETLGARLTTESDGSTYLSVKAKARMVFAASENSSIEKIQFSDDGFMGNLHLDDDQPDGMDENSLNLIWNNNTGDDVSQVMFYQGSTSPAEINRVTVTYKQAYGKLTATPVYHDFNVFDSLESVSFKFDTKVRVAKTDGMKITTDDGSESYSFKATAKDSVVTLTLDSPIKQTGSAILNLLVVIPAECITDLDDTAANEDLTYHYYVREPLNSFNSFTPTPAVGNIESLPTTISLKYDEEIKLKDGIKPIMLIKDGTEIAAVTLTKSTEDVNTVLLSIDTDNEAYTAKGKYTITIPAGYIHNNFYNSIESKDRWNAETTLTYNVGKTQTDADDELIAKAKALLQNVGVGYPATTSDSYTALSALVNAEETPGDEDLTAAIQSLYSETNIQLPKAGEFYNIAVVNSASKKLYLSVQNNAITLTTDQTKATPFIGGATDGGLTTLETIDGKYLHVLTPAQSGYSSVSESCLTSTYSADINDLTFAKLSIDGTDADKTYGLVSMKGGLGKNVLNADGYANALVNFTTNSIVSIANSDQLVFGEEYSSAFCFETVDNESVYTTLEPTITVNEAYNNSSLTVTFSNVDKVTVDSSVKPYVLDSSGNKTEVSLVATDGLTFTVALGAMANGSYSLVIPQGALKCTINGVEVGVNAISSSFKLDNADLEFDKLNLYFETFNADAYYDAPTLNDWKVKALEEIYVAENKYAYIMNSEMIPVKMAVFKEAPMEDFYHVVVMEFVDGEYKGNKLTKDPFTAGELKKGIYRIVVEENTIGDVNFGKYMSGDTTVKPSDCKTNEAIGLNVNIDADKAAAGIDSIEMDTTGEKVIYDITGRKLQSADKPGLYIINGKKVVVK